MPNKLVVPRLLKMRFHRYFLSYLPRKVTPSTKPLTVVMPLAVKDIYRASIAIASITKHVKHPITEMVIVGQDSDEIRNFCASHNLTYINENNVLPLASIRANTNNQSQPKPTNFVIQQIIKLTVFDYIKADNILVHDSDTYFMQDVTFFCGDRQILYIADEYTKSYEKLLFDFLGPIKRYHRSFVCHSMLFQRELFANLKNKIYEQCGLSITDAILKKTEIANSGGLSEFEIYGNYLNSYTKNAFETRYWYNMKIPPDSKLPLETLEARFWNMNTVSAHEH